jgi:glutaredoxin
MKPKITIVGKKGCVKCTKMHMILKDRGHETELVYPEQSGNLTVNNIELNITENTHFPVFVTDSGAYYTFKELNEVI